MKNKSLKIIIVLFLLIIAAGCGRKKEEPKPPPKDVLYVYDKEEKLIHETMEKQDLDRIVNFVTESIDKENPSGAYKEIPADAELKYHYHAVTKSGIKADMYIYENYPVALLENIPIISTMILELTPEQHKELSNPESFIENK